MSPRPTDPIEAAIHDLKLTLSLLRSSARAIEDKQAAREYFKRPFLKTVQDHARFKRSQYEATRRAASVRRQAGDVLKLIADLEAQQLRNIGL